MINRTSSIVVKVFISCLLYTSIVDLERRFLDTNGVRVVVDAKVVDKDVKLPEERQTSANTLEVDTLAVLSRCV